MPLQQVWPFSGVRWATPRGESIPVRSNLSYVRPTESKTLRSSFFFFFYLFADRPNCAQFPSLKCAQISVWLNPTGHSQVGLLVLSCTRQCRPTPYPLPRLFSCPRQKCRRRPVPVPVTGVRYNTLL